MDVVFATLSIVGVFRHRLFIHKNYTPCIYIYIYIYIYIIIIIIIYNLYTDITLFCVICIVIDAIVVVNLV